MIYITGSTGQLGQELPIVLRNTGIDYKLFQESEWDFRDFQKADEILSGKPEFLINTAAYTAVDKAESESELAYLVNFHALEPIALSCKKYKVHLIHYSTDFVFTTNPIIEEGDLAPWNPRHTPIAKGIYADSKKKGEDLLLNLLGNGVTIIRTSWLYSTYGMNFPRTILRLLMDPNRKELSVIEDQIGRPTWARRLSEFSLILLNKIKSSEKIEQIYHFSNSGIASWYDFAVAIQDIGLELGYLKERKPIHPIPTSKYPTPAKRPKFSVMDLEDTRVLYQSPHWRSDLKLCLESGETKKIWGIQ